MASEETVRCRKCRKILITESDSLINSHGLKHKGGKVAGNDEESTDCTVDSERSCLYLSEDSYPQFITDALDESSWTKGKLNCPGCQARIGSFNYVSGSHCSCGSHIVPQVHLLISKVDIRRPSEALPSPVSYPDRPVALTPANIESLTMMSSSRPSTSDCAGSDSLPSPGSQHHCNEESSMSFTSQDKQKKKPTHDSTAELNEELLSNCVKESPKKKQRDIKRRHRYEEFAKCDNDSNICEFSNKSNFQVLESTEQNSEDESDERNQVNEDIPLHLTCSVCLDLLYSPFIAQPCNHVFCEPCLRRLARRNPTKTSCPLCRQIIGQCLPSRDLAAEVREKFPDMYQERHEFEQNHNTQHIPLPWLRNFRVNQQDPYGGSLVRMAGRWKPILWMLTVNILGFGGLALLKWYLNSQKNEDGENNELRREADEL